MQIEIKNGDYGVSWAIKRQLDEEGINTSNLKGQSIWTEIMNVFQNDNESKVNGKTIAEQWTTLRANVLVKVGNIVTIAENTWSKIKEIQNKDENKDKTLQHQSSDLSFEIKQRTHVSKEAMECSNYHTNGKQHQAKVRKGDLNEVNSKNIAAAIPDDLAWAKDGNMQNKKELYTQLYNNLCDRMSELDLWNNEECYDLEKFKKLTYLEEDKIIKDYRNRILKKENSIIHDAEQHRKEYNRDINTIKTTINSANQFLTDIANGAFEGEYSYGKRNGKRWKSIELSDGRWIEVNYDKDGNIEKIKISNDTNGDLQKDGSHSDLSEVMYTKNAVHVNTNHNNDTFEYTLTNMDGYNTWDRMVTLVNTIFK